MSKRNYIVVIRQSAGKYIVRYFVVETNALRYRGTLDLDDFRNSGVYRLKNKGPHEFLYGYRTGYPTHTR